MVGLEEIPGVMTMGNHLKLILATECLVLESLHCQAQYAVFH